MLTDQEKLEKAKAKSLAHHFGKAAAHHEAKAGHHEKAAEMHKAHSEHHAEMAGQAEDEVAKKHHKASAAFHKSKATHHEKLHKMHKAYAAHHEAMKAAHEATEAEKVYKALEIEVPQEDNLSTNNDVNKTAAVPTPAATTATPATPAAPAAPATAAAPSSPGIGENFGDYIQKALDKKLGESVDAAFERLLNSPEFGQRVDQEVAKKMLEKLGATTIDTPIKTYAVPRPGETSTSTSSVDKRYENIREDLLDFVKSE